MRGRHAYCQVFVKDALPVDVPDVPGLNFAVRRNKNATGPTAEKWWREHSAVDYADPSDDFILWPQFVDIWSDDEESDHPAMVGVVRDLLCALWNAGRPALAACEFEDELPWGGGGERLRKA